MDLPEALRALRYTPAGTEIRVSTSTTPAGLAELVVEDEGPGIPPELAENLFERFVRGEGDRGGSFGLGLAIVQSIATSHGGSVALEPPLRGTRRPLRGAPAGGLRPRRRRAAPSAAA